MEYPQVNSLLLYSLSPSICDDLKLFGELVPYADPSWYQGWNSPYYNDSHRRFRAAMREIVEKDWKPVR